MCTRQRNHIIWLTEAEAREEVGTRSGTAVVDVVKKEIGDEQKSKDREEMTDSMKRRLRKSQARKAKKAAQEL